MFIKKTKKELLILFIVLILIFPIILMGTGTITSGWHLVDDHEIVSFTSKYVEKGVPFWVAFCQYLRSDLTMRFRPLHCLLRMSATYLFSLNSVIPNVLLCVMGMCTYGLLYDFARKMNCSILCAHLFSLIVVLGRQYEVWYRMTNQENTGLFLLAWCLWLIASGYNNGFKGKGNKWKDCLLTILAVLCGLMKESFMLLLPGIILLRLVLEGICNEIKVTKWWKLIVKHIVMCGVTASAFLFATYFIVKNIGMNSLGYAGIDKNDGLWGIIWGMGRMLKDSLLRYTILGLGMCIVLAIALKRKVVNKKFTPTDISWIVFCIYVMLIEMVLYAKSGMWNRYVIPFSVGCAFSAVILMDKLLINQKIRIFYVLFLVLFIGAQLKVSVYDRAWKYAEDGRAVQNMFQYVVENTSVDSHILSALHSEEKDLAVEVFLGYSDRKNIDVFQEEQIDMADSVDVIISDVQNEDEFVMDKNTWEKTVFRKIYVVYKKVGTD